MPSFQCLIIIINLSSVSTNSARSSAYNNPQGKPTVNFFDSSSSTMMNKSGLRTEPWCTPTFTPNSVLSHPCSFTDVETSQYIALITSTIHSSTPALLKAHQSTSRGTLSNAFSRSTNAIHKPYLSLETFLA